MKKNNILIAGPCRSGTTFLFNALASDQYVGVFQPFKHVLRCKLTGENPNFSLVDYLSRNVIIKEAFGPYYTAEAQYDPVFELGRLLGTSDPVLVLIMRDPADCFASWLKSFNVSVSQAVPIFTQAYFNTYSLYMRYRNKLDVKMMILDHGDDFQSKITSIKEASGHTCNDARYSALLKPRGPAKFEVHGLLGKAFSGQVYNKSFISRADEVSYGAALSEATRYYSLFREAL